MNGRKAVRHLMAGMTVAALLPVPVAAQQQPTEPGWPQPVSADQPIGYAILNQNELRTGDGTSYRWEGEGWYGGNFNRLWIKSEGNLDTSSGALGEAEVQGLYSHAVTAYFNLQAGVRYELRPELPRLGGARRRGAGAAQLGDRSLCLRKRRRTSRARLDGYYDLYLTQRLVLQPQFELNAYSRADRAGRIGTGLSSGDFGLRLRYELRRELAPYIGVTYEARYGATAGLARSAGDSSSEVRFVVGLQAWF